MAKNWALVIGIDEYNPNNLIPLRYAKKDAENIKVFFQEIGFDEICLFTDDSPQLTLPNGNKTSTYPSFGNLDTFLVDRFQAPFLNVGDNCWFFFAGHGREHLDRDYVMPIDANPRDPELKTALRVSYIRERLSRSGADNIIMILDTCRSQGTRDGTSIGQESQPGVIKITSCDSNQASWEIDELEHGVFTYALLEAMQLEGEPNCATVEKLSDYLKKRVPELCTQYNKFPVQTPRISVDPIEKKSFIIIPHQATQIDINSMKLDAYRLKRVQPTLAERICIRLNSINNGQDLEIINLLTDIRNSVPSDSESSYLKQTFNSPAPTKSSVLKSLTDIDYCNLNDLLALKNWKAADHETYEIMRKSAGKRSDERFTSTEILTFPCDILLRIDQLWLHYSEERFGFSIQKEIYFDYTSTLNEGEYLSEKAWKQFGERLGWREHQKWILYRHMTFDDRFAPKGHLPSGPSFFSYHKNGSSMWKFLVSSLISRLKKCAL